MFENGEGSVGGIIVSRLHQYKRHADIGPVSLEKDWDGRVEAGEAGVTSDSDFKFIEHGAKGFCPSGVRDGFVVVKLSKVVQRVKFNIGVGNVATVKSDKANK